MSLQRLTDADRVVILKQVFNKFVTFRMPDEFEAGRYVTMEGRKVYNTQGLRNVRWRQHLLYP